MVDPLGPGTARRSFRLLRPGGTLVSLGTLVAAQRIARRTPLSFLRFGATFGILRAGLAAAGRLPGGRRARFYGVVDATLADRPGQARDLSRLFDLLSAGAIRPVVTTLPLDDARRAHELLDAGEVRGQLVVLTGYTR